MTHVSPQRSMLYTRPLKHDGVRHASVGVYMTQSSDDAPKINCAKSTIFDPPAHLETPKDITTKSGETRIRTELYHVANSPADWHKISAIGQIIHIFPYMGLPWGTTVPCYTFLESSHWHVTLRLTVSEIFTIKIWDFGAPWGYPERGEDLSGTRIHHHAKFHTNLWDWSISICPGTDRDKKLQQT